MPQPTAADSLPLPVGQLSLTDFAGTGGGPAQGDHPPWIAICGRRLDPTPVFDTYWRFAAARQGLYEARLQGQAAPWTSDPILRRHRFTNCYRASDRVSQFLISQVIYQGSQEPDEVVFRTLLFKVFNRIPTWQRLEASVGEVSWREYDYARYEQVLTAAFTSGERLYSAAYVVPPPAFGEARKHANHLRLLELMMSTDVAGKVRSAGSLRGALPGRRHPPRLPLPERHQGHHRPVRGRGPDRGRLGAGHPHGLHRVARAARQQRRDRNPGCRQPLTRLPGCTSMRYPGRASKLRWHEPSSQAEFPDRVRRTRSVRKVDPDQAAVGARLAAPGPRFIHMPSGMTDLTSSIYSLTENRQIGSPLARQLLHIA